MSLHQSLNKEVLTFTNPNPIERDLQALNLMDLRRTLLKNNLLHAKSIAKLSLNALTLPNLTMLTVCAKIAIMRGAAQSWQPNATIRTVLSMHKASVRTAT